MAPKLPRGFAPMRKDAETIELPTVRTRPPTSKDASKGPSQQEPSKKDERKEVPKRSVEISLDASSTKKRRIEGASSHVANLFGPISAAYVGENDVHKWQSLPTKDQDAAMIKAAAQLLTQTIGRAQRCQEERLALEKERANSKKLSEMIVENDNKWKRDLDAVTADYEAVKEQLEESLQHRKLLNESNDKLLKEKEEMQIRLDSLEIEKAEGWSEKAKKDIHDAGFQAGFDFYCIGFLAQDPDYDWSKWGVETVEDMTLMKVERAADIRKRRIDLGIEDEGASSPMQVLQDADEIPLVTQPVSIIPDEPVDRQVEEQDNPANIQDASSVPSLDAP